MRTSSIHRRLPVVALVATVATGAAVTASYAAGGASLSPTRAAVPRTVAATSHFKQIKHVWTIVLENTSYSNSFGDPSEDPYLATTLRKKALLLEDYYSTGHASNDNYISLASGQEPNIDNQADCSTYKNFPTADQGQYTTGEPEQQLGDGCIYPKNIGDIGNQLSAKHLSWKGYMEDMGNIPSREAAACGHPKVGAAENTQTAVKGDGYADRHNPFSYFHQVIDNEKYCQAHVVALGTTSGKMPKAALKGETGLATDLKKVSTTPAYSFITPNLCDDGHDYPCTNEKDLSSKYADIDRFLQAWVPKIMNSPAYKQSGLIEITFDESDGAQSDSSACCGEGIDPNATAGMAGEIGLGGGRIGALLISPFIKANTSSTTPYNHYSTLATDEAIFGLPKLGWASKAAVFSPSYFTK